MRLIRPELPKDFVGQVEVNVFKHKEVQRHGQIA